MICDNVALQAQGAVSSHSRNLKLTCFTMSGSTQLFSRAVDAVKSQNREAPPSTRQERAKRLRLAPESPVLPLVQVRRTFVTIPEQMQQPTMRSSSEPPPAIVPEPQAPEAEEAALLSVQDAEGMAVQQEQQQLQAEEVKPQVEEAKSCSSS